MADISESAGPGSDVDYDELAGALLLRVVRTLSSSVEGIESRSWATRRIERTQERNDDLKRSLARIKAEMDAITVERDELRDRLANSEKNLLLLEERLTNGKVHSGSIATRLGAEERLLLHQLRNPTAAISNKAG
jgi:septal ring factor EnvC (AmiA/AmiB activator)